MALTKVTGHVIKSDTNIISHNINSSGIITAISFDGNVSGVAVTFTGDSTIGSLGITTNLNVGGISTFTGNIDANGDIDVDGHTNLDNVSIAGVVTATTFKGALQGTSGTFSSNVDITGDLDVDGHTNLDNVNIAGVVTATSFVGDGSALTNLPAGSSDNISEGNTKAEVSDTGTNGRFFVETEGTEKFSICLLYTSPSPRDQRGSGIAGSA